METQNRVLKEAFDCIVDDFYQPIFKYCYNMLRSRSEAEDAVQDIFIKVFKALDQQALSQIQSMSAWIYRIAYNHCLNMKRRQKLYSVLMFEFLMPTKTEIGPEEELLMDVFSDEIEQALAVLSFDQRTIFLLRTVDDLSYEQISKVMDRNEAAVRKQYERARNKIRKHIENQEGVEDCGKVSVD